jgi:hypothetical protein
MIGRIMLALLLLTAVGRAEAPERVEQNTQGRCSPTFAGTDGNATSVCINGVDPPPKMKVVVSGYSDVVELTDFLRKYDGERIELHVVCADVFNVCILGGPEEDGSVLACVFPKSSCTGMDDMSIWEGCGNRDSSLCSGAWWLYIDDTKDAFTQPGRTAGNLRLDGVFDVRVGVRDVPSDVTAVDLRAVE